MSLSIEALLSPADYQARQGAGFRGEVCVVFDVLRATSVMVTGVANGAAGFIPVAEISEAVALRERQPGALLAGEREGLKITAGQSGGVDFDLGNSPREFTAARITGRTIITTTTNGTRALRACDSAEMVIAGSFLNLTVTAQWLTARNVERLTMICAGTAEFTALEDILCAGALCDVIAKQQEGVQLTDSAEVARDVYQAAAPDLMAAVRRARNGRRLFLNPELRDDVAFCLQRDLFTVVAGRGRNGRIEKLVA
jgi:2-phosphosulfolactate phosphatase